MYSRVKRGSETTDESPDEEYTINIDPDQIEDRFRVDRRKLENMLQGCNGLEDTDRFFQQVMQETDTCVSWPSRLKIGAKSKKDPHIKVTGRQENVRMAKEQIMAILDRRGSNVTLKMDVPYTDHSHIIGKGGNTIKQVMQDTGCHIHFPDSNRTNPVEKSNQVSIAGLPAEVEKARCRVRALMPLVFSFELPLTGLLQPLPDVQEPTLLQIQHMFNVCIQVRQKCRESQPTVLIRGSQTEAAHVKEATRAVMEHLMGAQAIKTSVYMTLDISPQHHTTVMGAEGRNVLAIMHRTNTLVYFPDPTMSLTGTAPEGVSVQRKSLVTITGVLLNIDSVHEAWLLLVECLPLVLMFDLVEGMEVDSHVTTAASQRFNLNVCIRPKPRQMTKTVVIRGLEHQAAAIYASRSYVVGMTRRITALPSMGTRFPHDLDFSNTGHVNSLIRSPPVSPSDVLLGPSNFANFLPPMSAVPWSDPSSSNTGSPQAKSSTSSPLSSPLTPSTIDSGLGSPSGDMWGLEQPAANGHNGVSDITARRAPGYERSLRVPGRSYEDRRRLATRVMKVHLQGKQLRYPTNVWSGFNFSHSQPNGLWRMLADDADSYSQSHVWNGGLLRKVEEESYTELHDVLLALNLAQFSPTFLADKIDLEEFLSLTEEQLKQLNVTYGGRKKMMEFISMCHSVESIATSTTIR